MLDWAVEENHVRSAALAVQYGDPGSTFQNLSIPIISCVINQELECLDCLELLVAMGVDVNAMNEVV